MKAHVAPNGSVSVSQHQMSLRAHWLRGVGGGVLLQGAGLALAFASSVVLARVLGPQGLGHYSYVLSIIAVLSVLATLGVPAVLARQVAAYSAKEEWGLARGLLRWSNVVTGGMGLFLCLGLISVGLFGADRLYVLAAPLVLVLGYTNLRQRTLQGLHRPLLSQLPEQIVKHSVFLVLGGVAWILAPDVFKQPHGAMAIWLCAGLASLGVGAVLLHRVSSPSLSQAKARYTLSQWWAIALPIFAADSLGVIFGNTDTILLGWLRPVDEVGVYQVALRLSGLMLVLLGASNWVLAPWFARLHETGEDRLLQSVVARTTRVIFSVTLVAYLLMVVAGEPLLEVFFGASFIEAYPVMLVLGAGHLVNVATGPVVNLLAMTGGQRELALSVTIAAVANILLCCALIPVFGMIGAAIAVAVSNSAYNVLLAWIVSQRNGIGATILG